MRSLAITIVLCLMSVANAIEVGALHARDTPIQIKHKAGERVSAFYIEVAGGKAVWKTLPEAHFLRGDTQTVIAAPPRQYILTTGDSTIIQVAEGEHDDRRKDDGKVEPKPKPEPVVDKIMAKWVIWIEEVKDRGDFKDQTSTMLNLELRKELVEKGLKVGVYDKDSKHGRAYSKYVKQYPAMILMTEKNEERMVFEAPKSVEDVQKLIREHVVR